MSGMRRAPLINPSEPMKKPCAFIAMLLLASVWKLSAADNMKAFPPAAEGQVRHVLHLPKLEGEADAKVELIVGKEQEVDAQNKFFFPGKIEAENIQGWGYTRYVLKDLGPLAGTRMLPAPGTPNVKRFIKQGGEPYLIRYNSRLPVVIYVPDGVEVRYRIWSAGTDATPVDKG